MKLVFSRGVAAALVAAAFAVSVPAPAPAATPKDFLVIATLLDEFISLDPAEIYELLPQEYVASTYDRLIRVNLDKPSEFKGDLAESWTVSDDGLTFTFKLRKGIKFHSGNPLTADDVVWSLQRVALLNKGAASVIASIGLDKDTAKTAVTKVDENTIAVKTDRRYASTFVLNVLGSWPASVVDSKLLTSKAVDNDFGNAWLKTNEAGSGGYKLVKWTANESLIMQRNDDYRTPQALKRIVMRHVAESASKRLLLEAGDVDSARELSPDDIVALQKTGKVNVLAVPQVTLLYLGLNVKNPNLAKPEVQEAIKWLIDYDSIQANLLKSTYKVHQAFLPEGFLGAVNANPYKRDVAKAKALLAKAGLPDGFTVTIDARSGYPYADIAQAVQANLAQGGIKVQLLLADNKQTLAKYRARQHDIYLGEWAADYIDPHSNAQGFAWNPDNTDKTAFKMLAWRNSWDIPALTKQTDAALAEPDTGKREQAYQAMQKDFMANSPFVIMFQKVMPIVERKEVSGIVYGPINDLSSYRDAKKQ